MGRGLYASSPHKAMVDHISECRKRIITFFCLFILCSQCPSSIKTKAEEYNQCLHWIQKVRGIFVLFSWLKAPSVPLIDTKQKLYYTTHGCCLCALKCVFGLHWPWGHIFFAVEKNYHYMWRIASSMWNWSTRVQMLLAMKINNNPLTFWRIHW